ncbi:MAG TPA: MFS transporter [Streptosporangiaceae bacterium]
MNADTAAAGPEPASARRPQGTKRSQRPLGPHYKWIALSNTTLGVLMATINLSIVLIALPDIFRGIGINPLAPGNTSYLLWMIMGFMVVSAVLVVAFGRLGDMFGRVRMYNLGFAVFTVASILLTATWMHGPAGALWLIGWRVLQGIGGAFLFANSTAILTDAFPANQRGTALGMNAIAAIAGSFLGLLLGGVLAPVNWRLVFIVSVPFGVFGTIWAYFMLRDQGIRQRSRMDWWGNLLFAAGLIAILVGITYGLLPYGSSTMGWTNPWVLAALLGGLAALVVFVIVETKIAEPLFKLSLFRIRPFAAGNVANLLVALARGGIQFILILWLQGIWLPLHGYDFAVTPLWAGIYMVPLTIGFLVSAPLSGFISDRIGARFFTAGGALLVAGSFVCLFFIPVNFRYDVFAVVLVVNGFGSGLFASPNRAEIMNSVPANQRGSAGGMIATFQNTAFVLSIGIFFSLIVTGLASTLPSAMYGGLTAQGVPGAAAAHISHLPPISVLFAAFLGYNPVKQLLGPQVLSHLPAGHAAYLTSRSFFPHLVSTPFHDGLSVAFAFAIGANVLAAVASTLTGGRKLAAARAAAAGTAAAPAGAEPAATEPADAGLAGAAAPDPGTPADWAALPAAGTAGGSGVLAGGQDGCTIVGTVHDLRGEPVAGALLTVIGNDGWQAGKARTDAAGRFELTGIAPSSFSVVVMAPGHSPAAGVVRATQPGIITHNFVLAGSGGLAGSVVSAANTPLPGASVRLTGTAGEVLARDVTDMEGGFVLHGALMGSYTVTATLDGYQPASLGVDLNGAVEHTVLTLIADAEVHGVVRNPVGSPVPGVTVSLADAEGEIVATAVTSEDGMYRLTGVAGGEHTLVASGYPPASSTVHVENGKTATVTVRFGDGPAGQPAQPVHAAEDGQPDHPGQLSD